MPEAAVLNLINSSFVPFKLLASSFRNYKSFFCQTQLQVELISQMEVSHIDEMQIIRQQYLEHQMQDVHSD